MRAPRAASLGAPLLSAIERGVLDHPSHQLIKRNPRVRRELGHQRRLCHAGLGVDLETGKSPSPVNAVVVAEIRTAHAPTPERTMRQESESSGLLVNIWFKGGG